MDQFGQISTRFAQRLANILPFVEKMMRQQPGPKKIKPKARAQVDIFWGKLLEDLHTAETEKRCLRWIQNVDDGAWGAGVADTGTPGEDDYHRNDVYLVDDNLLEDGEWLEEGRWVVFAWNRQSGRAQVINWRGCPNVDGGGG